MEMYSRHNQGRSVVAERFIRTLENKICKYMTSISKNVYIDKLADIVDKYSSKYSTIKMRALDVNSTRHVNFGVENIKTDPKFKVGDHVRMNIEI